MRFVLLFTALLKYNLEILDAANSRSVKLLLAGWLKFKAEMRKATFNKVEANWQRWRGVLLTEKPNILISCLDSHSDRDFSVNSFNC